MSKYINEFAKTLRDSNPQKNVQPLKQNKITKESPVARSSTANVRIAKKGTLKAVKAVANATAHNRVATTTNVRTSLTDSDRATASVRTRTKPTIVVRHTKTSAARAANGSAARAASGSAVRATNGPAIRPTKSSAVRPIKSIAVRPTKTSAVRASNACYTQTAKNPAVGAAQTAKNPAISAVQTTSTRVIPNATTRVVHSATESRIRKSPDAEVGVDVRPLKKVKISVSSYPVSPAPATPIPASSIPASPIPTSPTQASPIPTRSISTSLSQLLTSNTRMKRLSSSGNPRDTSDDKVIVSAQSYQNEKAKLPSTSLFTITKPESDTEDLLRGPEPNDCTNQEDSNPISQARYNRFTDLVFYLNNAPLDTTIEDILDADIFPDLLVSRNPKLCEREVGDFTENAHFSWSKEPQLTEQLCLQEIFKDDISNYFNRTKFSQEEVFKEYE